MRTDKAFLTIDGKRLIDRVLDAIVPLFAQILINSNNPEGYEELGFPVIPDIVKDKGASGGIYTALLQASTDHVFCVACDMPSLNRDLIRGMIAQVNGFDALVPQTPDGFHPLHAIYGKRCIPAIEDLWQRNILKISAIFPKVNTYYLPLEQITRFDPHLNSFLNINTQQDLITAREKLSPHLTGF